MRSLSNTYMIPAKIVLIAALCLTLVSSAFASKDDEMTHLRQDLHEYRSVAGHYVDPIDKQFISDLAFQCIYKQWSLWFSYPTPSMGAHRTLAESYALFVLIQWDLGNPTRTSWGLNEFWTHDSLYTSRVDSAGGELFTYRENLDLVKKQMLKQYGGFSVFNELMPDETFKNTRIQIKKTDGYPTQPEEYVIHAAERDMNQWLRNGAPHFPIYLPKGIYMLSDDMKSLYPKQFTSRLDSLQFLYLTPNMSFKFVPVATVYNYTDSTVHEETLDSLQFELIRIDEGKEWERFRPMIDQQRVTDFDNVEYGRYLFRVNLPYELVDNMPSKLFIPMIGFGVDYFQRENELFDKKVYETDEGIHEVQPVRDGEQFVYRMIQRVIGNKER